MEINSTFKHENCGYPHGTCNFEGLTKSSYGNLTSSQEKGRNGNGMHFDMQVFVPLAWLYDGKLKFILDIELFVLLTYIYAKVFVYLNLLVYRMVHIFNFGNAPVLVVYPQLLF